MKFMQLEFYFMVYKIYSLYFIQIYKNLFRSLALYFFKIPVNIPFYLCLIRSQSGPGVDSASNKNE